MTTKNISKKTSKDDEYVIITYRDFSDLIDEKGCSKINSTGTTGLFSTKITFGNVYNIYDIYNKASTIYVIYKYITYMLW